MSAQGGEEQRKCQSPSPSQASVLSALLGLALGSPLGKAVLRPGGGLGGAGLVWGHSLWVLNDPLPTPPTHNPISIPTPSSGPVAMATVFSVALHQFLGKSFFLPPPSVSFSPPSACISTYSWCSPCALSPSFSVPLWLSLCPRPASVQISLFTAPLLSLPFQAPDCSNKLEAVG